jgi:cytidyltransferase-like protein
VPAIVATLALAVVILSGEQLAEYRGRLAMVSGGFDPIHAGHVAYFAEAARLGIPVLCTVDPDSYVAAKHPVLLPIEDRIQVLDAIRYIDYVHAASDSIAAVLAELRPRYFVKGADWRGRLPRDEIAVCDRFAIEVIYCDTLRNSSTAVLETFIRRHVEAQSSWKKD